MCKALIYFGLLLKNNEKRKAKQMAAVIPPAAAVSPPVKIPINPEESTCSLTPVESRYPNPVRGTVAPAPAASTRGSYQPRAPSMHPVTTYDTSILAGVSFVKSMSSCPIAQSSPPKAKA